MSMLMCDFHIHTTWSDGSVNLPEVVDIYGQAGFDVISITDHVYNSDSNVAPAPGCLREAMAHFRDPSVGLVSHLVHGIGAKTLGAGLWFSAFFSRNVEWRGRTLRITRGSRLVPVGEAQRMEPAVEAAR